MRISVFSIKKKTWPPSRGFAKLRSVSNNQPEENENEEQNEEQGEPEEQAEQNENNG